MKISGNTIVISSSGGAILGGSFGGPIGAVIGAVAGATVGLIAGDGGSLKTHYTLTEDERARTPPPVAQAGPTVTHQANGKGGKHSFTFHKGEAKK